MITNHNVANGSQHAQLFSLEILVGIESFTHGIKNIATGVISGSISLLLKPINYA